MAPDKYRIQRDLTTFNFKTLFIEELGWDTLKEAALAIVPALHDMQRKFRNNHARRTRHNAATADQRRWLTAK